MSRQRGLKQKARTRRRDLNREIDAHNVPLDRPPLRSNNIKRMNQNAVISVANAVRAFD